MNTTNNKDANGDDSKAALRRPPRSSSAEADAEEGTAPLLQLQRNSNASSPSLTNNSSTRRQWHRLLLATIFFTAGYVLLLQPSVGRLLVDPIRHYYRTHHSCSCYNRYALRDCCRRDLLVEHKFGTFLVSSIFQPTPQVRLVSRVTAAAIPGDGTDYRHIVTTRNWMQAIVSGYLYHRSGRECWLSPNGLARHRSKRGGIRYNLTKTAASTSEWDSQLWTTRHSRRPVQSSPEQEEEEQEEQSASAAASASASASSILSPARNARSLCQYLMEENEVDGLRAYADYALGHYYAGLVPYFERQHGHAGDNNNGHDSESSKSMFVCYEDWMDVEEEESDEDASKDGNIIDTFKTNNTREALYERSLAFLYPGGGSNLVRVRHQRQRRPDGSSVASASSSSSSSSSSTEDAAEGAEAPPAALLYEGGHATDHDPELRARLLGIVQQLDDGVFEGTIARSNAVFGCG